MRLLQKMLQKMFPVHKFQSRTEILCADLIRRHVYFICLLTSMDITSLTVTKDMPIHIQIQRIFYQ